MLWSTFSSKFLTWDFFFLAGIADQNKGLIKTFFFLFLSFSKSIRQRIKVWKLPYMRRRGKSTMSTWRSTKADSRRDKLADSYREFQWWCYCLYAVMRSGSRSSTFGMSFGSKVDGQRSLTTIESQADPMLKWWCVNQIYWLLHLASRILWFIVVPLIFVYHTSKARNFSDVAQRKLSL